MNLSKQEHLNESILNEEILEDMKKNRIDHMTYLPGMEKFVQIFCLIPTTLNGIILATSVLGTYAGTNTIFANRIIMLMFIYSVFVMPVTYQGIRNSLYAVNTHAILEAAEILIKYEGYIGRERMIADKLARLESIKIKGKFDYNSLQSLSTEARQKLVKIDPETIAQASRIPGVSASDINVLLVLCGR